MLPAGAAAAQTAHAGADKVHKLTGDITFVTVPQLWRQTTAMLAGTEKLIIDLGGVTRTDSAALALLVGWMRHARQARKPIEFQHLPEKLLATARVTGVEALLLPYAPAEQ